MHSMTLLHITVIKIINWFRLAHYKNGSVLRILTILSQYRWTLLSQTQYRQFTQLFYSAVVSILVQETKPMHYISTTAVILIKWLIVSNKFISSCNTIVCSLFSLMHPHHWCKHCDCYIRAVCIMWWVFVINYHIFR